MFREPNDYALRCYRPSITQNDAAYKQKHRSIPTNWEVLNQAWDAQTKLRAGDDLLIVDSIYYPGVYPAMVNHLNNNPDSKAHVILITYPREVGAY